MIWNREAETMSRGARASAARTIRSGFWQLVVDRAATLARLEVQVEPAPELVARCGGFSLEHPEIATLRRRVADRLQKAIGLSVELTIVAPRTLPRSEGKAVRVIERGGVL